MTPLDLALTLKAYRAVQRLWRHCSPDTDMDAYEIWEEVYVSLRQILVSHRDELPADDRREFSP